MWWGLADSESQPNNHGAAYGSFSALWRLKFRLFHSGRWPGGSADLSIFVMTTFVVVGGGWWMVDGGRNRHISYEILIINIR